MRKKIAVPVSFRLSVEARRLLEEIAHRRGSTMTTALEWIIREKAEALGIRSEESTENDGQAEA